MTSENAEHELDISSASNSLWLVKVPKYIATKWDQMPSGENVGFLSFVRCPKEKVQMSLHLPDEMVIDGSNVIIPREHKLNVTPIKEQLMTVFSEQEMSGENGSSSSERLSLRLTGHLTQKVNVCPTAETSYMDLKKDTIRKAFVPKRVSKQLDSFVNAFKPISDHVENIENRKNKKNKVRKYNSSEEVMAKLFEAFHKQRYYNIRDLVHQTQEPIPSLKLVLKDICEYNIKNPNKNMWELKKEFRHYTEEK